MVHVADLSAGFMFISGVVSLGLMVFAMKAYGRSRNAALAYVAGAFTVFALKSFFVGYALVTESVEHDTLELMDAIGDMATILLFVVPVFWPARSP